MIKNTITALALGTVLLTTGCFLDPVTVDADVDAAVTNTIPQLDLTNCSPAGNNLKTISFYLNNSESNSFVQIYGDNGEVFFEGFVGQSERFEINATGKKGFARTLDVFVDHFYYTTLKVDGSQPVASGYTNKELTVYNAVDIKGNNVCATSSDVDYSEFCAPCDGKVKSIIFRYVGQESSAVITVEDKNGNLLASNEYSSFGSVFSFTGTGKGGTVGPMVNVYIDGELAAQIHTSCSIPLNPGMIIQDFELIAASSRNGGILCD